MPDRVCLDMSSLGGSDVRSVESRSAALLVGSRERPLECESDGGLH